MLLTTYLQSKLFSFSVKNTLISFLSEINNKAPNKKDQVWYIGASNES